MQTCGSAARISVVLSRNYLRWWGTSVMRNHRSIFLQKLGSKERNSKRWPLSNYDNGLLAFDCELVSLFFNRFHGWPRSFRTIARIILCWVSFHHKIIRLLLFRLFSLGLWKVPGFHWWASFNRYLGSIIIIPLLSWYQMLSPNGPKLVHQNEPFKA